MKKLTLRHPVGIPVALLVIGTILIFSFVEISRAEDPSTISVSPGDSLSKRVPKISGWTEIVNGYLDMDAAETHGWRHNADIGDDNWIVHDGYDYTDPYWDRKAFRAETSSTISDKYLISPHMTIGAASTLTFYHDYDFETSSGNFYDGGVIEVSVAGGQWTDIGGLIFAGGYNGTIFSTASNPLAGQPAWVGAYTGGIPEHFDRVDVDLAPFDGNSVRFRWRMGCDVSIGGNTFWYIDEISVTSLGAQPVPFFTARTGKSPGGNESSILEWVNPPGEVGQFAYTRIILKSGPSPGHPNEGTILFQSTQAGQKDFFIHEPLTPFQTYYYGAWVFDGTDPQDINNWSTEKTVTAYTFESGGSVKWAFHMGATSLTPPGIGSLMGVANDRGVHSMAADPVDGGTWPTDWTPVEIGEPSQARPTVVTIPWPGNEAQKVIYISSQDGKVYAINGDTGGTDGAPPLWSSTDFGDLQAGVAGMFTAFDGDHNLLFVGSRNALAANTFYALDPITGATLFSYTGGADTIGLVSNMASVDYETNRVYFTSRSYGSTNPSVWCLSFTNAAFTFVWSRSLGHIDASPTLYFDYNSVADDDRIYVGNNSSTIYALNATTGATIWGKTLSPTDGAVKSFISADPAPDFANATPLYFSTNTRVWGLLDKNTLGSQEWSLSTIGEPSAPLFAITAKELYVGSSFGRLYQLNTSTGVVIAARDIGDMSSTVGSPALDALGSALYVGTEAGAYYAIELPLF